MTNKVPHRIFCWGHAGIFAKRARLGGKSFFPEKSGMLENQILCLHPTSMNQEDHNVESGWCMCVHVPGLLSFHFQALCPEDSPLQDSRGTSVTEISDQSKCLRWTKNEVFTYRSSPPGMEFRQLCLKLLAVGNGMMHNGQNGFWGICATGFKSFAITGVCIQFMFGNQPQEFCEISDLQHERRDVCWEKFGPASLRNRVISLARRTWHSPHFSSHIFLLAKVSCLN